MSRAMEADPSSLQSPSSPNLLEALKMLFPATPLHRLREVLRRESSSLQSAVDHLLASEESQNMHQQELPRQVQENEKHTSDDEEEEEEDIFKIDDDDKELLADFVIVPSPPRRRRPSVHGRSAVHFLTRKGPANRGSASSGSLLSEEDREYLLTLVDEEEAREKQRQERESEMVARQLQAEEERCCHCCSSLESRRLRLEIVQQQELLTRMELERMRLEEARNRLEQELLSLRAARALETHADVDLRNGAIAHSQGGGCCMLVIHFPPYWRLPPGPGLDSAFADEIPLPPDSNEFQMCARLVASTIVRHSGKLGGRYSGLKVMGVTRVQNGPLWTRYFLRREALRAQRGPHIESVASRVSAPCLDPEINEFYLFHGTRPERVEQLKRVGFNERYAKLQGMFGAGVYFAENSSKSNQYVPCPDCEREACRCLVPSEKPLCLMLCRVTMGETHLVHSKYSAREFEAARMAPCNRDSVLALPMPPVLQYPEFVIYDGEQAYPEYLIYYRRLPMPAAAQPAAPL